MKGAATALIVALLSTFPAGVPAQECGAAANAEGGASLYGLPNCPCLTPPASFQGETWEYRSESDFGAAGPDGPNAFNVTLNGDGLGLFIDGQEQDYGHLCGTHDWGTEPWCSNMSDPAQLNSWCSSIWCYVDAENCDLANSQTSYFPALKLHYSYAACASVNTFSSDATLTEDSGEGARKKLKEIIATTLIEDITGMPTHDTDLQLLSTLGEVDTWNVDEVRKGMYVQGQHLKHNAEKGGYDPFACLHMADSRGMWYGLFPSQNVGIRMPDPATADMYPELTWKPFTEANIQLAQRAGILNSTGMYTSTCTDENMHCNWPTWEGCDGFGDNAACDSSTCCLTDQLYFESKPDVLDESQTGDLIRLQQYDPRVRAWYYNAPIQYALTGQMFAWSDILFGLDHAGYQDSHRLTITATAIIPGNQGADGLEATSGSLIGGWYAGFDFSNSPATLTLTVDGVATSIVLSTDLSSIDAGVAAIDAGLGAAATATVTDEARILIESTTTGGSSTVSIDSADPVAQAMSFAHPVQKNGAEASAGTLVVERVPHRAGGSTAPLNALDPAPWIGFDFTEENEELILTIDGTNITTILATNLDSYAEAAAVITAGLAGAGIATVDTDGKYMTITSSTTGPNSFVRLGEGNSARVRQMLCPVIKSVLAIDLYLDRISKSLKSTFQDDIVYIVERSTGLLVAESAGEGVMDNEATFAEGHTGHALRKCAVNAETDLIRSSALQLENIVPKWSTMSLKLDETHLVDSRIYQRDPTEDGFGIDWLIVVVQTIQCPIGQALRTLLLNVECVQCGEGQISSDGLECVECPAGMVPNAEQSECILCPDGMERETAISCALCVGNTVSKGGNECASCGVGLIANDEKVECAMCPEGLFFDQDSSSCAACMHPLVPNNDRTNCVCPEKTFNSTNPLRCATTDFIPPPATGTSEYQCHTCEDLECVEDCFDSTFIVAEGWDISQMSECSESCSGGDEKSVFKCAGGETACLGGRADNTTCGEGYTGLLCNVCAPGFHIAAGSSCTKCEPLTPGGIAAIVGILVILLLLAWSVKIWYNYFAILGEIRSLVASLDLQIIAILKQFASAVQVISALGPVLNIIFPDAFAGLLAKFAFWFKFDISILIGVGCYTTNSHAFGLFLNIAMIASIALLVILHYKFQLGRLEKRGIDPVQSEDRMHVVFDKFDKDGDGIDKDDVRKIVMQVNPDVSDDAIDKLFAAADTDGGGHIDFDEFLAASTSEKTDEFSFDDLVMKKMSFDMKADAFGRLFLLVFVMYPGLTNKIFEGLLCRDLGNLAVLNADYTTECYTTSWYVMATICGALVIIWPIGLPTMLYINMKRDLPLINAEDEDTLRFWDFAIGDYNLEHWYWEVIELLRKMIMAGAFGLLGRGTIIQVFMATLTSFGFFAFAIKHMPFRSGILNAVKFFCELQLFVILLTCLVLQTDALGLASQTIGSRDDYGTLQVTMAVAAVPVAIYIIIFRVREQKDEAKEHLQRIKDLRKSRSKKSKMSTAEFDFDNMDDRDSNAGGDEDEEETDNPIVDGEAKAV